MSNKILLDPTVGVNETSNDTGVVIARDTANVGFSPFKVYSTKAITTSSVLTAGDAGVSTITGTVVHTITMPTAASCPGAEFVFRSLTGNAHIITGSQETAGTLVFVNSTNRGSSLTLLGAVSASVILKSTGCNFLVLANSGALTINGT